MRTILWPVVAVTFFSTLCNAQDDAVAAPTGGVSTAGVSMGYAAQGNVAMSKARHEAELERAALAACQQKALKGAMACYAQPPPITTAEQFLAANRPRTMPPREGDTGMSPVKTSTYVPEFETTTSRVNRSDSGRSGPSTMSGRAALPERKPGLVDFFKSKKIAAATVDPTLPCTSSA